MLHFFISYLLIIIILWKFYEHQTTTLPFQMVRYGHKKGQMVRHTCCTTDTWFISLDEKDIEDTLGKNFPRRHMTSE